MTHIVVEGIDNSGKSTLIDFLILKSNFPCQRGEGPPRSGEDMNDRIAKYAMTHQGRTFIYDRHPVVSQPIYSKISDKVQAVAPHLNDEFYASKPIIIYCDPLDRGLGQHKPRTGAGNEHIDTPEFLAGLKAKYDIMLGEYRLWAARHADLVYRIGDSEEELWNAIQSILAWRKQHVWLTYPATV